MVVGNSLGGWIAAWVALDWREGVSKLILVDSAGLKTASDAEKETRALLTEPTVESMKELQRRAYYQDRPLPDHVWSAVVRRMKSSNSRAVRGREQPEDFLDDRLPTLRTPTLLLWGQADRVSPPETMGQAFKSLIPGSIWHELPQCGHLSQKE